LVLVSQHSTENRSKEKIIKIVKDDLQFRLDSTVSEKNTLDL
jgi:hypothetical protein